MIRLVPYIFPILVNYVLGGIFFITPLRCAQEAAPGWVVGATTSVWAFVYTFVSYFIGKKVTSDNAAKLIIAAGFGISLSSLGFLIFPGVYTQFIWIACVGISIATYCTSFQVFAKAIEPDKNAGVARASSLYTASWSIGMATGPFIFGFLSISTSFIINAVIGLLISAGIYFISRFCRTAPAPVSSQSINTAEISTDKSTGSSLMPDLVFVGWLLGGIGTVAIFVIRTLVPYRTTILEFSKADAGIILATVSYTQALAAVAMLFFKKFMYQIRPMAAAGICSVISLLIFGYSSEFYLFMIAACIFGIYSGYFYFMFVYHSLISPGKSTKYVATNEIIVGITGTLGPFAGGLLSTPQNSGTAFPAAAVLCAASVVISAFYIFKHRTH